MPLTEEDKNKLREATAGLSFNGNPLTQESITAPQMPQETQDLSLMGLPDISQPPIYSTAAQAFGDAPVNLPINPLVGAPQQPEQPIEEPQAPQAAAPRGGMNIFGGGGFLPTIGGQPLASTLARGAEADPSRFVEGSLPNLAIRAGQSLAGAGGAAADVAKAGLGKATEFITGMPSPVEQAGVAPAPLVEAPTMEEPLSPFEGSFLAPDGTTVGLLRGGGRRIMTPEDMSLFDAMNEASGQASVIGGATPSMPTPEGMQRTMSGGEVMFADPTTAAMAGQRESEGIFGRPEQVQAGEAGSPQSEFAARAASGEPLSQQEIAGYQAKAAEMGTTFDPQRGYSRDPFLTSQRGPSGIQQASFEAEQRIRNRPDFGQAISDREKRGDDLSLGDYRNMLRAEGWKGSAQIAKAKQMMGEALSEREEAMVDKQGKLLNQERTQQIINQAKSPEATSFQKKRGEWFEREESLREDGASPEEIAARRRAFLYGDKFDAWEFGGNGTQPQMETATTGSEAAPTVTDEASYNALKSGQKYIHNGKEYTKK